MIPASSLPPVGASASENPIAVEKLSEDDLVQLAYLDSEIEEAASSFTGEIFSIGLNPDRFPLRVVHALKALWESGGWIVAPLRVADLQEIQLVFARPRSLSAAAVDAQRRDAVVRGPARVQTAATQPPLRTNAAPRLTTPLLVRMPTRGRPSQALEVLTAYRELASEHVKIEVVIDEDDGSMNCAEVLQRLYNLDCSICVGRHRNKIEAVNGGRVDDWAILALVSDDMVPIARGYDQRIREAMSQHFPLLDGAVYFNDGYNRDHVRPGNPVLCTLPVMGRHLYDQFGYVYFPAYGSIYSDDEQTNLLTAMRRLVFVDEIVIEHRHHAAGKAPFDALYRFNDETYGPADKALLEQRSRLRRPGAQFAFDSPPLWLSILVCSTVARRQSLRRLDEHLRAQMREFPREVELCVAVDNGELSVGAKRQALLERSVGHYVAFIDDDDWVDSRYVERVLDAVRGGEPDCASLEGVMTTDGARPERFTHSITHGGWYTKNGVHYRTPNHLSAVRRDLALKAGFVPKNVGEDHEYSKKLAPLLTTEASTGSRPLYFYFFAPTASVQSAARVMR